MELRTATFPIPIKDVPVFKGAARQLELDLVIGEFKPGEEMVAAYVLIVDESQLVTLGFIAGMDAMHGAIKDPLGDFISSLERKVEDYEAKNNIDDKID